MTTDTVNTAMVGRSPRSSSTPRQTQAVAGQRKLPRPIVFWSLNEKTAYRRNRVVQTRMNMVMDDIATQKESSRRWIRYEAHKFRQRSGRYFNHPCGNTAEKQSTNIAPAEWIQKHVAKDSNNASDDKEINSNSDDEIDNDDLDENDEIPTKKTGIITQGRKSVVKFSVTDDVNERPKTSTEGGERKTANSQSCIRSMSAFQYRESTSSISQTQVRQQSAMPTLYNGRHRNDRITIENQYSTMKPLQCQPCIESSGIQRRSDTFFDKSKAAYELRIDLQRRASLRKHGVSPLIFTIKDALQLEREKFSESREKILRYINNVEAVKRTERSIINKWNRGAVEQELSL